MPVCRGPPGTPTARVWARRRIPAWRRDIAFAGLLDHPVGGAGASATTAAGRRSAGGRAAQRISSTLDCWPRDGAARTSQGDRTVGGQLTDGPPPDAPATAAAGPRAEFAEARTTRLFDVDGGVTADGGDRPERLELAPGHNRVTGAGADLLRVAQQQRRDGGGVVDESRPRGERARTGCRPPCRPPEYPRRSCPASRRPRRSRLSSRGVGHHQFGAERTSSVSRSSRHGTATTTSATVSGWSAVRPPRTSASR